MRAGVLVVPLGKGAFLKAGAPTLPPFIAPLRCLPPQPPPSSQAAGTPGGGVFDACAPAAEGGEGGTEWAFWASCGVASGLSFALKLVAHVLQQKLIGETFRSRVAVRAFVAPNSIQMKAVRAAPPAPLPWPRPRALRPLPPGGPSHCHRQLTLYSLPPVAATAPHAFGRPPPR